MNRKCDKKCLYWSKKECTRKFFDRPEQTNFRGVCKYYQDYIVCDGVAHPITDRSDGTDITDGTDKVKVGK